jgi:oligo-1,6-glucosidase
MLTLLAGVSRFGDDSPQWRERSAKMLAMLFGALSGTLFVYQGQEIGMINMPKDWPIEEYKDVDSINYYRMVDARSLNDPLELAKAHASLQHLARDHARTPMQWTGKLNGGFTDDENAPWMRVNTSAEYINVAEQQSRNDSVLAFWRQLLKVRKEHSDVLVHGDFELVDAANKEVFSFVKRGAEKTALIVCNFSGERSKVPVLHLGDARRILCSNVDGGEERTLQPWEGRIYLVD